MFLKLLLNFIKHLFGIKPHKQLHNLYKSEQVLFTFDDGPSPETLNILAILKKYNIKAVFFVIGKECIKYPDILHQIVKNNHILGNHSYSHPYHKLNQSEASKEIIKTDKIINNITHTTNNLYRLPGGKTNTGLYSYLIKQNAIIMDWTIDSLDYIHQDTNYIVDNVMSELTKQKNQKIVLFHDGCAHKNYSRKNTTEALEIIINKCKQLDIPLNTF